MKITKCPKCGSDVILPYYPIVYRVECMSAECHLNGPMRTSKELAAQDWNDICEDIRVGAEARKAAGPHHSIGHVQWKMNTAESPTPYLRIHLEPIPEAPLDPLDVLRKLQARFHRHIKEPRTMGLREMTESVLDIDTVLEQAKETDK